jgi:hypothetical protein
MALSKAHRPPHINRYTGELLRNIEQVCSACHLNFATMLAGDGHRVGKFGVDRHCANPEEVGLIKTLNKYGTTVWRKK